MDLNAMLVIISIGKVVKLLPIKMVSIELNGLFI